MKAEAKKSSNIPNSPPDTQHTDSGSEAMRVDDSSTVPVELPVAIEASTLPAGKESVLSALAEEQFTPPPPIRSVQQRVQPLTDKLLQGSNTLMRGLSLDERWGRILLSVVLAILLWFYVTGLENPSQATIFRGLQLEVRGLEPSLKLVNTSPLPTIDVSFQAPQNVLSSLSSTDIHPSIDLTGVGAGVHRVPVNIEFNGRIGDTINNLTITPPNYQVQLEVQATESYSVEVSMIGTAAYGYNPEQPQVEPDRVTITGSESAVNRIARVVVTVDIDQKAATQRGFNTPVALDNTDQPITGLTITPAAVQVTVPIKLLFSNRLVPIRVPIIGNPAPGYSVDDIKIEPTTVLICCAPGNILEGVDSVTTGVVAITGTATNVVTSTALILPAGVQLYPGQSNAITVTVSVRTFDTTWQLSVSPVVQGLPDGYVSVLSPTSLELTLSGTFAQFQALTPTDVQATLDVTNLGGGTYELSPNVTFPQGITLVSSNPPTITVSIIPPTPIPPTATSTPTNTPIPPSTPTPTDTVTPNPELTSTPSPTHSNTPTPVSTFPPSIPATSTPQVNNTAVVPTQQPPTAAPAITPTLTLAPTVVAVPTATPETE